jgi:ABC-type phosphate transport system substrate-binding protein
MDRALLLLTVAWTLAATRPAAGADCTTLANPVYVTGSTAAKPILAAIAKVLVAQTPPVTIVYAGQGSCVGVDAILNGTALRGSGTTALSSWDESGAEAKCDLPTTAVAVADIGVSDVFASTCFSLPGGVPSNVQDFLGPVQAMTFVVPKQSSERSISAEAAYYVFGFGAGSGAKPWTDESWILHRDDQSGTQRMISAAIGVGPSRWKGTVTTSSSDLLSHLTAPGTGAQALGILSADVAQANLGTISILAYQNHGQACGYTPDRDATTNEKINVRDGHYAIWGPLHLLTRVTNTGYPATPAVADVIGYVTGTKVAPPGLDLIALEARTHVVPECAMRVKRVQEMGALASFAPSGACGCYYEKVANGRTACQPCMSSNDCPTTAPACSYGYCETQ